jgi:chemotaxis protein MotB
VPNRISLTGHTDVTPYAGITGYTNWDLSTDRANAARRALESSGLATDRVSRVVGLSSSVLFDRANPRNPINRRISIVVLTTEAEHEAQKTDIPIPVVSASGTETAASAAPVRASTTTGANLVATTASAPLSMNGTSPEPGSPGPIIAIDKPINPPMGAAPVALPASAAKTQPSAQPPVTAAPKHPIPSK